MPTKNNNTTIFLCALASVLFVLLFIIWWYAPRSTHARMTLNNDTLTSTDKLVAIIEADPRDWRVIQDTAAGRVAETGHTETRYVSRRLPMSLVVFADRDMTVITTAVLFVHGRPVSVDAARLREPLVRIALAHVRVESTRDPGQADLDSIYSALKQHSTGEDYLFSKFSK